MIRIKPDKNGRLTQWDLNRKVMISGIPDETGFEVHFESKEDEHGAYVLPLVFKEGEMYAEIPNILLTYSGIIRIFIFDGDRVVYNWQCPVLGREKPDDYVYTETEVLRFEKLEDEIEKIRKSIVQGDWTQNDADAMDYIKNRPGAYEATETTEVFHITIPGDEFEQMKDGYDWAFGAHQDYDVARLMFACNIDNNTQNGTVTINGTSYPMSVYELQAGHGIYIIGDPASGPNEDYPFRIIFGPVDASEGNQPQHLYEILLKDKCDQLELTISVTNTTVHKIPAKYLEVPEGLRPDWNENDAESSNYINNRFGCYETDVLFYRNPAKNIQTQVIPLGDVGTKVMVTVGDDDPVEHTVFQGSQMYYVFPMIGTVTDLDLYDQATDAWVIHSRGNGWHFAAKGKYADKLFKVQSQDVRTIYLPAKYLNMDDIYTHTDTRYIKTMGKSDAFIRDSEESYIKYQYYRNNRYFDNMYIGFMYDADDKVSYPRIYANSVKGELIDINGKTHAGSYYGNITEDNHIANKKYVDDQIKGVSVHALNEERGYMHISRREADGSNTVLTGAEIAQINWTIERAPLILPYFDASEYGHGYACIQSVSQNEDDGNVTVSMDIFKPNESSLTTCTGRKYTWETGSTSGSLTSPGTSNRFDADSDMEIVVKDDNIIECYNNHRLMTVSDLGNLSQKPAFFRYDRTSNAGSAEAAWYLGALIWAITTSGGDTIIRVLPIADMNNLTDNYKYTNKLHNALRTARVSNGALTRITVSPESSLSVVTPDYVQSALYMPEISISRGYATIRGLYVRNSDSYSILTPAQVVAMKSSRFMAVVNGEGIYGGIASVDISKEVDGTASMICRVCATESVKVSIVNIKFGSYETSTSGSVQYPVSTVSIPAVAAEDEVIEVIAEAGIIEVLDAVMGTDGGLYEAVLADENGDVIVV